MEDPDKPWPPIQRGPDVTRLLAWWLAVVGVIVAAIVLIVTR